MTKEKNYSPLLVNAALCVSRPKGLQIVQTSFVWHKLVRKERKPSFLPVNAAQSASPVLLSTALSLAVQNRSAKKEGS